jgi:predicted GIY-YIG superfamily endonuclease
MYEGYIYKITDPNDKVYIGSTVDVKQRWKQHQESTANDKLHTQMKATINVGWKCKTIATISYICKEQLLIQEALQIIEHNSIVDGYNTLLPIDVQNMY